MGDQNERSEERDPHLALIRFLLHECLTIKYFFEDFQFDSQNTCQNLILTTLGPVTICHTVTLRASMLLRTMAPVALFAALLLVSLTDGLPSRPSSEERCERLCAPEARTASPEHGGVENFCKICDKKQAPLTSMPAWVAGVGRNMWTASVQLTGKARAAMEQAMSSVVASASSPRAAAVALLRRGSKWVAVMWKYVPTPRPSTINYKP